jgi:hypothetical protein
LIPVMKWSDLPLKPTARVLRQFSVAWLLLFAALAARQGLLRHQPSAALALGLVALLGGVGLFKPGAIRWLFIGATVAAFPIGWAVTQLMLMIMFFLVLTPLALVFRLMRRDELQLRQAPGRPSYWTARGAPPEPGRYLKQY